MKRFALLVMIALGVVGTAYGAGVIFVSGQVFRFDPPFSSPSVSTATAATMYKNPDAGVVLSVGAGVYEPVGIAYVMPRATLHVWGDSISACILGVCPGSGYPNGPWPNWVTYRIGLGLTNHAVSGSTVAEQSDGIHLIASTPALEHAILIGTNDQIRYCTDSNKLTLFKDELRAMIAWLAVTDPQKVKALNTVPSTKTPVYVGSWIGGAYTVGKLILAASGSVTFTTNGNVAYVESLYQVGSTATYSITIDAVNKGTFTVAAPGGVDFTTVGGRAYAPNLLRFTGLGSGDHTVVLAVVSGSGAQANWFQWATGNGWIDRASRPKVVISKIISQQAAGYGGGGGCSEANVATYNAAIVSVAAEIYSDGYNVAVVDARTPLIDGTNSANPIYMFDNVHPNAAGNELIATTFMRELALQ